MNYIWGHGPRFDHRRVRIHGVKFPVESWQARVMLIKDEVQYLESKTK